MLLHTARQTHPPLDIERFSLMADTLQQCGVQVLNEYIQDQEELAHTLRQFNPDMVFASDYYLENAARQRSNIHTLLEKAHIPYVGSTAETLELVLSKFALKQKWEKNGVNTPTGFWATRNPQTDQLDEAIEAAEYPYILKPNREGNSRGLDESSIVFNQLQLERKTNRLLQEYPGILIESYLGVVNDIREFTVAMIGNQGNRLLMPAEITLKVKKKLRLITTQDKDEHFTLAEPVLEETLKNNVSDFAEKAFDVAGVRDYARCDILMIKHKFYAIEINGQPMIPDRWFETCSYSQGLREKQYLPAIILAAIERYRLTGDVDWPIPAQLYGHLPESALESLVHTAD
jgi:D-alanine-D-alanine ligase